MPQTRLETTHSEWSAVVGAPPPPLQASGPQAPRSKSQQPPRSATYCRRSVLQHLLEEFALSFTRAEHLVVIRTPPGAASALAEGLDRVGLADVAGTIAGDNTILVVGREGVTARSVERALIQIMEA